MGITAQEQNHLPTQESILSILAQSTKALSTQAILRLGGYKKKRLYSVEEILRTLEHEGLVIQKQGFIISPEIPRLIGQFVVQRSGACFVIPEDKRVSETDIFIPLGATGGAWARDTVEVLVLKNKSIGRRSEGLVVQVYTRATSYIVARIVRTITENTCLFVPLNTAIATLFTATLSSQISSSKQNDTVYLLKPNKEKTKTLWSADVIKVIGAEEDAHTQEQIVIINHSLPESFPPDVLAEVEPLGNSVDLQKYPHRVDMQHIPFVTIDGEDSRDFDDAICVIKKNTGYILYVAIADVTEYVKPHSALDAEALRRSNSYYFPQSVIPMLPEALSNILCSLQPHVPRLAMVVEMHYSEDGVVEETKACEAIICSHARLTYRMVQNYLDTAVPLEGEHSRTIEPMLDIAHSFTKKLCAKRLERGGLFFQSTSPYFIFSGATVHDIVVYPQYYSHSLIEECMLATNEAVAELLTQASYPVLYRIHPMPTMEKLEKLQQYVSYMYPKNTLPVCTDPQFLSKILAFVKGKPQESVMHTVAIRSMMQARYSPEHGEHFGLQSLTYCHFTSPIRRYADVIVHRSLKALLHKKGIESLPSEDTLCSMAEVINTHERIALDAEREIQKRLAILYMRKHSGEEYKVLISGIGQYSIFVEFPAMSISGSIALSALSDDYYEVIENQQRVQGTRTGKSYALGDALTVHILEASLDTLDIQCLPKGIIGNTQHKSGKRYPKRKSREGDNSSTAKGNTTEKRGEKGKHFAKASPKKRQPQKARTNNAEVDCDFTTSKTKEKKHGRTTQREGSVKNKNTTSAVREKKRTTKKKI